MSDVFYEIARSNQAWSEPEKRETHRLFISFFVEENQVPHPISLISLMFLFMDKK